MRKRKMGTLRDLEKITVDINELAAMLSVGKNTADRVGKEAGAVVQIGRRKLYNVNRVQEYIETISEV